MVDSLWHVASERPAHIGVGIAANSPGGSSSGSGGGGGWGSGVANTWGEFENGEGGLSVAGASVKIQWLVASIRSKDPMLLN
jgi:hypothetical protein